MIEGGTADIALARLTPDAVLVDDQPVLASQTGLDLSGLSAADEQRRLLPTALV